MMYKAGDVQGGMRYKQAARACLNGGDRGRGGMRYKQAARA